MCKEFCPFSVPAELPLIPNHHSKVKHCPRLASSQFVLFRRGKAILKCATRNVSLPDPLFDFAADGEYAAVTVNEPKQAVANAKRPVPSFTMEEMPTNVRCVGWALMCTFHQVIAQSSETLKDNHGK